MEDFDFDAAQPATSDDIERFKGDVASGVEKLRNLVLGELKELEDALLGGDMDRAMQMHAEVGQKLSALHMVEHNFASLGAGSVVRASDLQEGMNVRSLGRVVGTPSRDVEQCATGRHEHDLMTVNFEGDDEPTKIPSDMRLVVLAEVDAVSDSA